GNSAGQAANHLSRYAREVTIVCRGDRLASNMSRYLQDEIEARANVTVRLGTEVVDASGEATLAALALRGEEGTEWVPAEALFVLIGAHPLTDWLPAEMVRAAGYIVTGEDLEDVGLERRPLMLETSVPGIFAVGDVRSRSVKRVAAAVG